MKERIVYDLNDTKLAAKVAHALSSSIRLEIIKLIRDKPLNISTIASTLQIPVSSVALHISYLEEAGIIITTVQPGLHGAQKVCALNVSNISFDILSQSVLNTNSNILTEIIPIGNYFDFEITPPCGIVSKDGFIGSEDRISGFYSMERYEAQLLWFTTGYLEYRIPTERIRKLRKIDTVTFSFEICSEAPGYQNDWKSDIFININDTKDILIESPGDYGGRKGQFNPAWWDHNNTQYGDLYEIRLTTEGTYLNEVLQDKQALPDYHLVSSNYISLKIGVHPDARYAGGLNLFGASFGDYPQPIVMNVMF